MYKNLLILNFKIHEKNQITIIIYIGLQRVNILNIYLLN